MVIVREANDGDPAGTAAVFRAAGLHVPRQPSERHHIWVAVSGGNVVGAVEGTFDSDFNGRCRFPPEVTRPHGYLSQLGVLESSRRKGVGTDLLRAYCEAAVDAWVSFIVASPADFDEGMTARSGFFARYGLVEVGTGLYHHLIGATPRDVIARIRARADRVREVAPPLR